MSNVNFLREVFPDAIIQRRPFTGHPWSGRDFQGYGRKIPTDIIVIIGTRWYRVYCCCYSNSGTCYINTKDHKFLALMDTDLM